MPKPSIAPKKKINKSSLRPHKPNGKFYAKGEKFLPFDPRHDIFISSYMDPMSPTFANARRSALKAGFSDDYASQITYMKPKWFVDLTSNMRRDELARENLDKFLNLTTKRPVMSMFGPVTDDKGNQILQEDAKLLGHKKDVTLWYLEKVDDRYRRKKNTEDDLPPIHAEFNLYFNESNKEVVKRVVKNVKATEESGGIQIQINGK